MSEVTIERLRAMTEELAQLLEPVFDAFGEGQRWDAAHGRAFLANPDNAFWLARIDGDVAGFASGHYLMTWDQGRGEVLLYDLAVAADFRRRGVGRALVDAVKAWTRDRDAEAMWVLAERDNEAAMATYRATGGVKSEDDTVMFTYEDPEEEAPAHLP